MTKLLCFLWLTCCCIQGQANEQIQAIYQQANEIMESRFYLDDKEGALFQFYCDEIAKLDGETLKNNPELVVRKCLAWINVIGEADDFSDIAAQVALLQADLKFVMDHAKADSRVFFTAKVNHDFFAFLFSSPPQDYEEFAERNTAAFDHVLGQWASDPTATGRELREDIITNLANSPQLEASFYAYVSCLFGDPLLALGYVKPKIKLIGLAEDEDQEGKYYIVCKIKYETPGCKYSISMSL